MQVDRKRSTWPWLAVLAALMLFCLMVPRSWDRRARDIDSSTDDPGGAALDQANDVSNSARTTLSGHAGSSSLDFSGTGGIYARHRDTFVLDNDLLSLLAAPTIDDLIALRLSMGNSDSISTHWPVVPRTPTVVDTYSTISRRATRTELDPAVVSAFEQLGRAVVAYAPAELIPRLSTQAARVYQVWSTHAVPEPKTTTLGATLRILGPLNRYASNQPADVAPMSESDAEPYSAPSETDPWCVPQILLEQLERVAQHPQATWWARRTIHKLHELTKRDGLGGDDVQSILADLCGSAEAAMHMAEATDDDRLRVELLRAHWALARRLDRWSVAHDIRVAAIAGQRFAARGSLGTYFDASPEYSTAAAAQLTLDLEQYEGTRDPQLARNIVLAKRELEASDESLDRAMADAVEQHYRNANVRVAISAEMLNRFVGQDRSEVRQLRERIGGAAIRGQSRLQSSSQVKLDPASGQWNLDIESEGTVHSNALADGGQARFRSQTSTAFSASKRVVVDSEGVLMQPASVDVNSHNRLLGVTTDVDWVPLVRTFARDRARQEYQARQSRARAHVESKVAAEASSTIDAETQEAVARVEKQIQKRVTDRLAAYGVEVTPIELTTTEDRVIARLRVASDDQAGSHTPRPRALSDSLASAQIHETALTNAAVSLDLNGRRFTAAELAEHIKAKFPNAEGHNADQKERDAVFQFAAQDAVRFHIEDGRLEVTLAMSAVDLDGRRMRNFFVHAFYVPSVNGLQAELVRDGSLGIEGRLSSGDRARLHNVFNSVLPEDRRIPLVRFEDSADERLEGLMITQMVLEDGWLGMAVGPATMERVAERSRSLR